MNAIRYSCLIFLVFSSMNAFAEQNTNSATEVCYVSHFMTGPDTTNQMQFAVEMWCGDRREILVQPAAKRGSAPMMSEALTVVAKRGYKVVQCGEGVLEKSGFFTNCIVQK